MFTLEYLPTARSDMIEIAKYIGQELGSPDAAQKLADDLVKAAERLVDFPYSCPVQHVSKHLKNEYRKLVVKNYAMFYWVDETKKKIVIARVIYSRRDYQNFLQ